MGASFGASITLRIKAENPTGPRINPVSFKVSEFEKSSLINSYGLFFTLIKFPVL
jgi:hypothetical protein